MFPLLNFFINLSHHGWLADSVVFKSPPPTRRFLFWVQGRSPPMKGWLVSVCGLLVCVALTGACVVSLLGRLGVEPPSSVEVIPLGTGRPCGVPQGGWSHTPNRLFRGWPIVVSPGYVIFLHALHRFTNSMAQAVSVNRIHPVSLIKYQTTSDQPVRQQTKELV